MILDFHQNIIKLFHFNDLFKRVYLRFFDRREVQFIFIKRFLIFHFIDLFDIDEFKDILANMFFFDFDNILDCFLFLLFLLKQFILDIVFFAQFDSQLNFLDHFFEFYLFVVFRIS